MSKVQYQEGRTLIESCKYTPQRDEKRWKTWCKVQENGRWCKSLITGNSASIWQHSDQRVFLQDNTDFGLITITIPHLMVNDSGNYRCEIYDSDQNTTDVIRRIYLKVSPVTTWKTTKHSQTTTETPLTTKHFQITTEIPLTNSVIPLNISRLSHSSLFWNSSIIHALEGLIVTKGLVFTALVVLLNRCRGPGKGRSHCELSQKQND
ncbi:natural cytotoxicity triggering receptor 2-like isoform X2 [Macrotis lagotis]